MTCAQVSHFFSLEYIRGDGHCGFRSIAHVVYKNQERWHDVRTDLLQELQVHQPLYESMGLDITGLAKRIACAALTANVNHWYSSHECSIVAATCYKRPIAIITSERFKNAIYIPILTPFTPESARSTVFLYYAYSHYQAAIPKNWDAIEYPRVDPQTSHQANNYTACKSWLDFFDK